MRPRALGIGLIVSAALNLFLTAWLVTLLIAHPKPVARNSREILREAGLSLDPPGRSAFDAMLRAQGAEARSEGARARELRRRTWESMAQAPFDAGQAKVQLAQARAINTAARARVEDAVIDFAAALPASERAHFGTAMSQALVRPPPDDGTRGARP